MNDAILFRFPDRRSAFYAFDTFEELGYEVEIQPELSEPEVHVHITKSDVTSALEIAQACGGQLIEKIPWEDNPLFSNDFHAERDLLFPEHSVNE